MTPLLILFFDVKPVLAVGTDLMYGAITKTAGGYKHLRQRTVDMRLSWWMAAGSVPAAIVGVLALELLESSLGDDFDKTLLALVAGAVLFAGFAVGARGLLGSRLCGRRARQRPARPAHQARRRRGRGGGRLHPRRDLGGLRRPDRRRADPRLPAQAPPRGRHRRLPRRDPAVGRRGWRTSCPATSTGGLPATCWWARSPGSGSGATLSARMPGPALRGALAVVLTASGIALSSKAGWGPSLISFVACAASEHRHRGRAGQAAIPC